MLKKTIWLLLSTILIASCDITKKRNMEVAATGNDWYLKKYMYSDGNSNRYIFSKNGFEYFPVSPAESSSGIYDGGRHIKKLPALKQFYELVDIIKASYEATADYIQKRELGTGLIEVRGEDNKLINTWILKYNSDSQKKLEAKLKLMKGVP